MSIKTTVELYHEGQAQRLGGVDIYEVVDDHEDHDNLTVPITEETYSLNADVAQKGSMYLENRDATNFADVGHVVGDPVYRLYPGDRGVVSVNPTETQLVAQADTAPVRLRYDLFGAPGTGTGGGIAGAVGGVLFVGTGGIMDEDAANFYWDAINNRLGILTNSPTKPLTVGAAKSFTVDIDGSIVADVDGFVFDAVNNRAGFGTASPLERVHIAETGKFAIRLEALGTGGGYWNVSATDSAFASGGGRLVVVPNSTSSVNSVLTIMASTGRVGFGTNTPSRHVHVVDNSSATVMMLESSHVSGCQFALKGTEPSGREWRIGTGITGPGTFSLFDVGASSTRLHCTTGGLWGFGTTSPTATIDVLADRIRLRTAFTPASAGAAGNQGDIAWDANFIYVCTATNTWKRAALSTW